ncbi:unnamed protein product [Ambrosiozyma monospora]|uniref:Unnamed protein product n=1 Tax=Ambrosiozyma monospora TaxID=43982 RepID=A0ACB5TRJ4_AMBMO|nr:unnamed protein product [Ambrosiozyma monospora]
MKGYRCPVNSVCKLGDNPYNGSVSFDDVYRAMELVFVVISANTFTDLMYKTMNSDAMAAALYFIFAALILKVWISSLIVAVIINSYKVASEHKKESDQPDTEGKKTFEQLHEERKIVYNDYVAKTKRLRIFMKVRDVFVLFILLNFMRQCFLTSDSTAQEHKGMYFMECATTIALLIEIIVMFLLFLPKWKYFFYSLSNCADLFLAIATGVIALPPVAYHLGKAYPWLTIFSIARFYRVAVWKFTFIRNAWASVFTRIKPFFHLGVFFVMSVYLIGIFASRLFEGVVPIDEYLDSDQLIILQCFAFHSS